MSEDNKKKDNRPNHSNIPSQPRDGGQGQGQSRRRHHRHHSKPRPSQNAENRRRASNQEGQRQKQESKHPRQQGQNQRHRHPNRHRNHPGQQKNRQDQGRRHEPQERGKPRHHLSPEERLMNQYWIHLEEYLQARKSFFIYAHAENEAQRIKYKRNYQRALEKWRIWQDGLGDYEKEVIARRNYEHRLENSYSTKNGLTYDRSLIDWEGPFMDQHFLKRQMEADYKGDIEETSGTMEDYQKIKDGFIPAKYRET